MAPLAVLAAILLTLGASAAAPSAAAAPKIEVLGLTADYRVNPLADDSATPVLGWQLRSSGQGERQTAYQVEVWTDGAETDRAGTVWEPGRVNSSDQVGVAYGGPALQPATRYHWRARVWDATGQPSAWSQPAWWETGLDVGAGAAVGADEWSGAGWIGTGQPADAPLLRKEFTLAKPVAAARAYVLGLGWYELHLNGRKVDDRVLTPANTQYQQTLRYDTYDVTDQLHPGANAVGAWLGTATALTIRSTGGAGWARSRSSSSLPSGSPTAPTPASSPTRVGTGRTARSRPTTSTTARRTTPGRPGRVGTALAQERPVGRPRWA